MRVLSYNIHKGIGGRDRLYRLERVMEVIEQENPDLICLQEVDQGVPRSGHHDQPAVLADHFKAAETLYQLNVPLKVGGYGNLVLSRWPFERRHQLSLRLRSKKPRGAQVVVIRTPEGPMRLVNWHLGLADGERQWQVRHLLGHKLFREADELPTLLIGDTNDWRNRLGTTVFNGSGFVQVTAPVSRFRSFPAYLAVGSLDKAYCRGPLRVRQARVVRTPMSRVASDHLPLVIDFHLGETPLDRIAQDAAGSLHDPPTMG
jgi:endonuclease/exonuclease/phosphatase family metal-dependent hydrolase